MAKFKVGDKVIRTQDPYCVLKVGIIAKVIETKKSIDGDIIKIDYDNDWYNSKSFELVEESKMKTTICLKDLLELDACEPSIRRFQDKYNPKQVVEVKDILEYCTQEEKEWLVKNGFEVVDQQEKEWEEFFQQVKGKKIRWSGWGDKKRWIIPIKRDKDGIEFEEKGTGYYQEKYYIEKGFNKDVTGKHWELYQEEEEEEWFICWDNKFGNIYGKRLIKGIESEMKLHWENVVRAKKSDFEFLD